VAESTGESSGSAGTAERPAPGAATVPILTPDHRLRVFVSSTLSELAPERDAARSAIRSLRLSPVMFEQGPRPHPPDELYRACLAQSDIFVGIYWQTYGWVAPGADVSGIEDEYRLSGDRPRLIYVKEPAPERESRLADLLDRIRADGRASYKRFESPGDLAELLVDDIAVLLSERFVGPREVMLPSGTVTFLFCDIEDSTLVLERIGDRYADVLGRYHDIVASAATTHGGVVVDREGDGVFCAFETTIGALEAAVDTQRELGAGPVAHGVELRARMGVHTGHAAVAGGGYVGLDVHRAARIGAAGHGGQVVVSSSVEGLAGDAAAVRSWALRDLGSFALKGLSRPERLFQLVAPDLRSEFPPPRARRPASVRLPSGLSSLVGRERDVQAVITLFGDHQARLVTLVGMGGIGKTRLGVAVAERQADEYADGIFFVDLSDEHDAGRVLSRVVEAIGISLSGPALETLTQALAHQRVLLVLDNFEQILTAGPAVAQLLSRCPGLHALVTSRVPLRVQGEHEYRVDPLSLPAADVDDLQGVSQSAAVQLFEQRARAVRSDFRVTTDTASDVAAIVRHLDGLPLAIELAAARLRLFGPRTLLQHLSRSLDSLGHGPADVPQRQRTLRATLEWSHELLTEDEQRFFRRLSVFAGHWNLDAADVVCGVGGTDTLALVESLVDKSLVRVGPTGEADARFSLLVTVREYGAERLDASGELSDRRQAHADHFVSVAEACGPSLQNADHSRAMRILDDVWEDMLVAIDWLVEKRQVDSLVRLCSAIWIYVWVRGHLRALAPARVEPWADKEGAPQQVGRLLWLLGSVAYEYGEHTRARELLQRSIAELRAAGDDEFLSWAVIMRAMSMTAFGADPGPLADDLNAAVRQCRDRGSEFGEALALVNLGAVEMMMGDVPNAVRHHRQCLEIATRLDIGAMIGLAHTQLGLAHLLGGDLEQSHIALAAAVDTYGSLVYWEGLAFCLEILCGLATREGHPERAMVAHGAADSIRQRFGIEPWPSTVAFLEFFAPDNADTDPDLQTARTAGRMMEPLDAATLALHGRGERRRAV
jgi:predicted ATPase/class 3 adenylate cyclase